jgi:hypothetical protein
MTYVLTPAEVPTAIGVATWYAGPGSTAHSAATARPCVCYSASRPAP